MSSTDENIKKLLKENPWLEEPISYLKDVIEKLLFRLNWLEMYTIRMTEFLNILVTDEQKKTDEYQSLFMGLHEQSKMFNPEGYKTIVSGYKKMAEEDMLKIGVHPERVIEKYRKLFPLEDLPQIITFDFIKTHFGEEQLKLYKGILKEGRLK